MAARYKRESRDTAYRYYLADALYCVSDVLSKRYGGLGMTKRFADIIDVSKPREPSPVDKKTQDEIIDKIWSKIGG